MDLNATDATSRVNCSSAKWSCKQKVQKPAAAEAWQRATTKLFLKQSRLQLFNIGAFLKRPKVIIKQYKSSTDPRNAVRLESQVRCFRKALNREFLNDLRVFFLVLNVPMDNLVEFTEEVWRQTPRFMLIKPCRLQKFYDSIIVLYLYIIIL